MLDMNEEMNTAARRAEFTSPIRPSHLYRYSLSMRQFIHSASTTVRAAGGNESDSLATIRRDRRE